MFNLLVLKVTQKTIKTKTTTAATDTSTDNINHLYFNYQTFFATDLVERIKDAKASRDYLVVNNKDHFIIHLMCTFYSK